MAKDITIQSLDPNTFEYQTYSDSDSQLIVQSQLDTVFSKDTDYIEYYVYDQNKNLIYPGTTIPLLDYDIRNGDVLLNPSLNLTNLGFDLGVYNILYTFYRKRLASDIGLKYFIADISSDRTEIRLDSNIISNDLIISSSNEFTQYRENADYFVDFFLNFGENQTIIANNIRLETEQGIDPTVLIKLYEPLPNNFSLKDELWVVEELSLPQAYELDFPFVPIIEDDFTFISGPNYNLNIIQETSTGGEAFSFNTLLQSDVTSSINQIQNLLNQKEIDINVNYENYANFVHFSSAKIRLENFYYKVGLIESASNQLAQDHIATSPTLNTPSYRESKANLTGQIDSIIKNFDGYESFLYFNSGSQYSYPKQNTQPPFQLYSTGSIEALTWVGNATVGDTYYGGQALSGSDYDQDNRNWLYWSIPEYLRDDPANEGYELFVDMVAQYYDNVWVYTKDISNKFDADNRLEYGIAKDLVAEAIKDFGVKLYASNFNTNDLFTAFLGITPSGSAFPFPEMTGSLPTESGFEYVDTKISASNDIVPLNNVQKQVYKRIYHNIPYLLKTKGTVAGIRALITSYGIPDTILRISEFGGKDRNEAQDYDLKQDVFNYAFDTGISSSNFVSSSFQSNTNFGLTTPKSIQFRFKPSSIPSPSSNIPSTNIRYSQSIFLSENCTDKSAFISLEYTGSGFVSGSYSGSSINPYDYYGTLKFFPESEEEPTLSASVYLPFFNGDWWSIQANYDVSNGSGSLYAANEIDGKIGFTDSSSILIPSGSFAPLTSFSILGSYSDYVISEGGTYEDYVNLSNLLNQFLGGNYVASTTSYLNLGASIFLANKFYTPFSGSFQELRYWTQEISQSNFYDFTVNPYSNEGNGINSTPDQQFFRAALGTQLDTGSTTSIHPRVTGSAVQITQSFANGGSSFYTSSADWLVNREDIFQDQVPAGIKNRITDKIHKENLILAEAPYGFQTPTSSTATISSTTSSVLSPMESIQQQSFVSQSYTPNVNYLEVAFSPSNQINDDINAQLGFFNLGDYIGDPRFVSSSLDSYPDLDRLRDAYFEKYIKGYDVVDFVRLIKFFDNSLFKMIKDFTPARTSLASGVVVKQHLLERNRLRPAQVTSSQHVYEGLVVNLPKNYSSGSSDFPQYSTEGSALYKFSGGPGGSFNRYNGLQTSPSGSKGLGPDNRFNLTQSWTESFDYGAIDRSVINSTFFNQSSSQYISASYKGIRNGVIHSDQSEFYTGVFTGSYIEVTNGDLNEGCEPYLNVVDTPISFKPIFFSLTDGLDSTITESEFLNQENYPPNGYAWIASKQTVFSGANTQQVTAVKLSQSDVNGVEIISYLDDFSSLRFLFNGASLPYGSKATEYIIEGRTIFSEHALLRVSQAYGQGGNNFPQTVDGVDYYPITSSNQGGSMNWSLEAKTDYSTILTQNSESSDNVQQNNLSNPNITTQEQNIFYWSGSNQDALGFFNSGSESANTEKILDQSISFTSSAYTIPYTPNIPLVVSASILYSSSLNGNDSGVAVDSGIYHSGSLYEGINTLVNQDFTLGLPSSPSKGGFYVDLSSPQNSSFAASQLDLPTISDDTVYVNTNGIVQISSTTNPTTIWADINLSVLAGLNDGKYYKFSNGTDSFVAQIFQAVVSGVGSKVFVALSFQSTNPVKTSEIPFGLPNISSFIPAPRYVLDLGTVAFNGNNWNTQIPGNSGSGASMVSPYAGHPKIKSAGTASMDWNFPSLTLAGTAPTLGSGDAYSTVIVDIYLKKTGSFGGTPYDVIITSSVFGGTTGGYSGSIYSGSVLSFGESPILNIENTQNFIPGNIATTSSTQNELGDMYYVEYSMSNFVGGIIGGITQTTQDVAFQTDSDLSKIEITQSYGTAAGTPTFNATGSIILRQGNTSNPLNLGNEVATLSWNLNEDADGTEAYRVNLTGSFDGNYTHNDVFRFSARNSKVGLGSGLHIENITASLFPSQSIWSPITPPFSYNTFKDPDDTGLIVPSYYPGALPFNLATDCQPLLNNFVNQRTNPYLMDIDYNFQGNTIYWSSSLAPVNFKQILSGSAVRAAVPVSNYTQFSSISPRYLGAKSTSQRLNVWSVGDTGTFGKNPTVELRDAYFGYFNDLDDPYPNINNLTRVNLNYLIDEQGNALPPSLNQLSIDTFQTIFPNETLGKLAVKSGNNQYRSLGKPATIERIMQYVTPIMYSQNSGDNYTNIIPLSGSGYISRYDNDDEGTQIFSGFNALGEVVGTSFQPQQSIDLILNPTSSVSSASGTTYNPWNIGNTTAGAGVAYYDEDEYVGSIGEDLPNQQIITLQSSIVTSFISETKRVRDELQFNLHLYTGSLTSQDVSTNYNPETEVGFNLEDITCTVYTDDGRVTDIGSVLEYGWFSMTNIVNYEKVLNRTSFLGWRRNRWKYSRVPVPTGGISCTVDWEMFETLFDLGLMRERFPKGGAGVKALEWNITANSGNYNIKIGDELRWRFNGSFKDKRSGYKQGFFFPLNFEGQYTSVNIEGVGAYDHLLNEANTSQAPFWVFTGSSGGGSAISSSEYLVMSSSNMNEAYGQSFRQADLDYFPGSSDFFPMGVEPKNTKFDNIEYSLELQIGDEIRFANNENFTYTIKEVFPPQNNNATFDRKNRLKVKVDKPVDTSINKDFFLVRRPIINPNSLYLNTPFPYESLSSASMSTGIVEYSGSRFALTGSIDTGSAAGNANLSGSYSASFSDLEITSTPGILYPDFPTEYLVQSASIIVNNLISKGIIES